VGTTAIGQGALASGANSTALGAGASTAGFANSTAIGAGAVNTRANQVALGTTTTTYTLSGVTSAASLAAQTGPTQFVTTDANGNLATSNFSPQTITNLNNAVNSLGAGLSELASQVQANKREARQGVAIAFAGVNASMPSAPGRTSWVINAATYKGEAALAGSLAHRLDVAMPLAITAGVSVGMRNSVAVKGGLQGEF
jgi:autotransporter adhesin